MPLLYAMLTAVIILYTRRAYNSIHYAK